MLLNQKRSSMCALLKMTLLKFQCINASKNTSKAVVAQNLTSTTNIKLQSTLYCRPASTVMSTKCLWVLPSIPKIKLSFQELSRLHNLTIQFKTCYLTCLDFKRHLEIISLLKSSSACQTHVQIIQFSLRSITIS